MATRSNRIDGRGMRVGGARRTDRSHHVERPAVGNRSRGVLLLLSSSSATPFTEAGLIIGGTIALQVSLIQLPHTDRVSFPSVHGAFVFIGCTYIGLGLLLHFVNGGPRNRCSNV